MRKLTAPLFWLVLAALAARLFAFRFLDADLQVWLARTAVMPIVVSAVVLAASLYVILSNKYDDSTKKWAFGTVGTILGHWLT